MNPTEPVIDVNTSNERLSRYDLHAVSFVGELVDDQLSVDRVPSSHHSIRGDNQLDIVRDVFHLSNLVM
jgi:hypothetical protein